jgi:hypothetical protein
MIRALAEKQHFKKPSRYIVVNTTSRTTEWNGKSVADISTKIGQPRHGITYLLLRLLMREHVGEEILDFSENSR